MIGSLNCAALPDTSVILWSHFSVIMVWLVPLPRRQARSPYLFIVINLELSSRLSPLSIHTKGSHLRWSIQTSTTKSSTKTKEYITPVCCTTSPPIPPLNYASPPKQTTTTPKSAGSMFSCFQKEQSMSFDEESQPLLAGRLSRTQWDRRWGPRGRGSFRRKRYVEVPSPAFTRRDKPDEERGMALKLKNFFHFQRLLRPLSTG